MTSVTPQQLQVLYKQAAGKAINGYHAGRKKSGFGGDDGRRGMEEFLQTRVAYLKYR